MKVSAALAMFLMGTLTAVSSVINDYPVLGAQALRYAGAAAILLAVARLRGLRAVRLSPREWALLLALAAIGLVGFNVCVVVGTRYASPAALGIMLACTPVVLAVIGPLMSRGRPRARVVAGGLIVTGGAVIANGMGEGSLSGFLLGLGALACEVAFSLLALPLLPRLGPLRVSAYCTALAVPLALIAGAALDGTAALRVPTPAEAGGLIYLGVVVTAVAFFLWYGALPRLGADRAGLFAGVVPIGAMLSSAVLGLGTPTTGDLIAAGLVIAGIAVGLGRARVDDDVVAVTPAGRVEPAPAGDQA